MTDNMQTKQTDIKERIGNLVSKDHLDALVAHYINAQIIFGERYSEIISSINNEITNEELTKINTIKKEDDNRREESTKNKGFDIINSDLSDSAEILGKLEPDVIYKQLD